jgi:hypothetical protein
MVKYGQQKGAVMGFYSDNCRCHEKNLPTHYDQDAHLTEELGWDGIKIDSCGNQRNMTEWALRFEVEGRDLLVESCGNGPLGTEPKHDFPPQQAWIDMLNTTCPFSLYRTSVDVAPQVLHFLLLLYCCCCCCCCCCLLQARRSCTGNWCR